MPESPCGPKLPCQNRPHGWDAVEPFAAFLIFDDVLAADSAAASHGRRALVGATLEGVTTPPQLS